MESTGGERSLNCRQS